MDELDLYPNLDWRRIDPRDSTEEEWEYFTEAFSRLRGFMEQAASDSVGVVIWLA